MWYRHTELLVANFLHVRMLYFLKFKFPQDKETGNHCFKSLATDTQEEQFLYYI